MKLNPQEVMVDEMKNISGFLVSAWGYILSNCPSAHKALIYISLAVGVLQAIWLVKKIFKD